MKYLAANGVQSFWSFVQTNRIWFIVGGAILLAVVIVVIAATVSEHKRKRNKEADERLNYRGCEESETLNAADEASLIAAAASDYSASAEDTESEQKPTFQSPGKWVIKLRADEEYFAYLYAGNGERILSSESYSSENGARNGIKTLKSNVEAGQIILYSCKNVKYFFKVKSGANQILGISEIYYNKSACENAIRSCERYAKTAIIQNTVEDERTLMYYTPKNPEIEHSEIKGKWKIVTDEEGCSAQLYANNGELLLTCERVANVPSAKKTMENAMQNIAANRFVIDKDKFGKYFFRLRNATNKTLCFGEPYTTFTSCVSAIESVRRFSANSVTE